MTSVIDMNYAKEDKLLTLVSIASDINNIRNNDNNHQYTIWSTVGCMQTNNKSTISQPINNTKRSAASRPTTCAPLNYIKIQPNNIMSTIENDRILTVEDIVRRNCAAYRRAEAMALPYTTRAINSQTPLALYLESCVSTLERNENARVGRWTPEEEAFATNVITEYEEGRLALPDGVNSLRQYIALTLNCSPMRVSKKFAIQRTKCYATVGKRMGPGGILTADMRRKSFGGSYRRGRWDESELIYAEGIIEAFKNAWLPLPKATSLRHTLSSALHCDPMRVSKKYSRVASQRFSFYLEERRRMNTTELESEKCQAQKIERLFLLEHVSLSRLRTAGEKEMSLVANNMSTKPKIRISDLLN